MAYGSKAFPSYGEDCTPFAVGDLGFLVSREGEGIDDYTLSRKPATLVGQDTPRLRGFLGSWNNVAEIAHGLGRVVAVDAENDTIRVVPVVQTKVAAALADLGYPELSA